MPRKLSGSISLARDFLFGAYIATTLLLTPSMRIATWTLHDIRLPSVIPRNHAFPNLRWRQPAFRSRQFASSARCCQAVVQAEQVKLRPYQQDSIWSVLDYLEKGEKRLGISLATGSGKTVIFTHLIDRIPCPTPQATQTLILAHRRELVDQAAAQCRRIYPDKTIEVEMGKLQASGTADITVASVRSLVGRLSRYDPDCFKVVLVDEAHHIVAAEHLTVLRHFRLVDAERTGPASLVGVSATFSRHDGVGLGKAIDHIVFHKDYVDMIEDGYLSDVVFTTVQSRVQLNNVKQTGDDFQIKALSEAVNNDETNLRTVRAWLDRAEGRKSTLVFCVDLSHVAALTAMFRTHGVDARFVTSDTSLKDREERLAAFKSGAFPVLLNCGIYTEGTDIPNIDCVLLARPTQSRNLLVQMIGRGVRKSSGKKNCHVIDMVASLETGIVTSPTLFGLNPDEMLEEADFTEMKTLQDRRRKEQEREQQATSLNPQIGRDLELSGDITFTDYDSVNDLIDDTAGERHIRQISRHAWVQIDEDKYILSNQDGGFVRLLREDKHFVVTYTKKIAADNNNNILARPREIGKAIRFEDAVHAADTFVGKTFPFEFVAKSARWRRAPATDGQITYLNKFRGEGEKLQYGSITKGRAGDRITKIKHGARGSFKRHAAQRRDAQKKVQKKEQWRDKQRSIQVKVGPVGS
ncbi:Putative helicase, P-loop containing nucleoside triphosphate hydrolase [Septoria linicola]|uniref:Helicase, P-loop containing nucleoside triphosphate hydrolase n=1 Tax=Septoria linicola TaxID=215465 RepID=A0A9Q9EJR9_9PEZI|nr:Putative helicase, P-loop containing nucleoside triphosphate hydrolase [Septoria linicola]